MKKIDPDDLLPMNFAAGIFPLKVQLAYACDAPPNIFGTIYDRNAQLWLHRDLARIVLLASLYCAQHSGHNFVLYDGLRTIEAQAAMAQSKVVLANPQWLQPPRLLSPPGAGAHPRGMAIDIGLEDKGGLLVDMGTEFDHLAENSSVEFNPAHRDYAVITQQQADNRNMLDSAMTRAAEKLDLPLYLLPQEWWDFRMPEDVYSGYAPLSDLELPPAMRMVSGVAPLQNPADYKQRFETLKIQLTAFI